MEGGKVYDTVIVGGGPAGLLISSELSKKFKVLVIDKMKIGETTKNWTTEESIIKKTGFERFISAKFGKCYLKSFKDNKFIIYDKAVSIDEKKLLLYLKNKINSNGSDLKSYCEFLSLRHKDNYLRIKTSKGDFFLNF